MKWYVISGEDSGDLHASNLIKALQQLSPDATFRGVGGDKLAAEGMELLAHIRDINFMGFWEVITHLGTIRKLFRTVEKDIANWKPDAVILVDYPGFNLRIAKYIKSLGIKIYYYISPQVWAWKKGRVKTIKALVDKMLVILPFEEDFYRKEGLEVDFVGHPLLDVIKPDVRLQQSPPVIALLPGSRKQEIKRNLPVMLDVIDKFPEYKFVVAGAPSQNEAYYASMIGNYRVELLMNQTYSLLQKASYAIVASGTATLETALFRVPQVVCYKGSLITYLIAKSMIEVPYISLVNLILNRGLLDELIQDDCTSEKIAAALTLLMESEKASEIQNGYQELQNMLGNAGASRRAAECIWGSLGK